LTIHPSLGLGCTFFAPIFVHQIFFNQFFNINLFVFYINFIPNLHFVSFKICCKKSKIFGVKKAKIWCKKIGVKKQKFWCKKKQKFWCKKIGLKKWFKKNWCKKIGVKNIHLKK